MSSARRLAAVAYRSATRVLHVLGARRGLDVPVRSVYRRRRWTVAAVTGLRRPVDVMADNLEFVARALDGAGIEPLLLPNRSRHRYRLAVPETRRADVVAALRAAAQGEPVQVSPLREAGHPGAPRPVLSPRGMDLLRRSRSVAVHRPVVIEDSSLLIAEDHACDLEFHQVGPGGALLFDTANLVTERVTADEAERFHVVVRGRGYATLAAMRTGDLATEVDFPIDAVYTWVDGDDPRWRAERDAHLAGTSPTSHEAANHARYLDRDDLRYSLRSVYLFADWLRRIFVVTDRQVPAWLADDPRVVLVDHREIFPSEAYLPTFNSHAIETCLHRIDGLAEHYLYLNDDVHLGRRVVPELFFDPNGDLRIFRSKHQLEPGPARPQDPPVMSAGKNVRDLLRRELRRTVTHKVRHVPHPQRRSVLEELEKRFPDEVAATRASRFRSHTDISMASQLLPSYAHLTGRATAASLTYAYLDSAQSDLADRLAWLDRARDRDVFCINDTTAEAAQLRAVTPAITAFLERYFPGPSPFERQPVRSKREGLGK